MVIPQTYWPYCTPPCFHLIKIKNLIFEIFKYIFKFLNVFFFTSKKDTLVVIESNYLNEKTLFFTVNNLVDNFFENIYVLNSTFERVVSTY